MGYSNDNFIAMTSANPTTIPNIMQNGPLRHQSQFNETGGFGGQGNKLENNNMKQMISTGTPKADAGGVLSKYESSKKVVSF